MNQVFTDDRFPGFEVHNEGSNTFHVYERQQDGQLSEIDTFSTFSDHPSYQISPEIARKRALEYFERMAHRTSQDLPDREPMQSRQPEPEFGKNVSLNDLMGGKILSADDVMAAYEKASTMTDAGQKEKALEQVRQMSSRLESAAQEIVRRLLD
jgi:hypothetical protein